MKMNRTDLSYRELHEGFVSGNAGTTTLEISLATVLPTAVIFLRDSLLFAISPTFLLHHRRSAWLKFIADFITLILPPLLGFTFLNNYIPSLLVSLLLTASLIIVLSTNGSNVDMFFELDSLRTFVSRNLKGRRPFITYFRASINVATAICIMAVDFAIFPRRFAKVETFGTGFMDVGVGMFVISNALVAPEARNKSIDQRKLLANSVKVLRSIVSSIPLIILGIARLLSVKAVDYNEHVSEYGIHWNFFFTLATVKVLSTCLLCFTTPAYSWILAVVVGVLYQYSLLNLGLQDYILQESRLGILDSNKEGIFSCWGYVAIYFAGIQLGQYIFLERKTVLDWLKCFIFLILMLSAFWVGLAVCEHYTGPISRRLANLPYVIWIVALGLHVLSTVLAAELVMIMVIDQDKTTSENAEEKELRNASIMPHRCLLEAVNYNGLAFFFLANLLTGIINLSIKTIYTSPSVSFFILTVYMFVLCAVIYALYLKKISVKMW